MKYRLIPYSVDLDHLHKGIGSRDRSLVDAAEELLRSRSDWWNDSRVLSDVSFRLIDAVTDLVSGEISCQTAGRTYGHALQVLCEALGKRLPSEHWTEVRWAMLEAVGLNGIMGTGPPVELPPIPDFPTIGHLDFPDIVAQLSQRPWAQLSLNRHELQEKVREFESWLQNCRNERTGLVLFYY